MAHTMCRSGWNKRDRHLQVFVRMWSNGTPIITNRSETGATILGNRLVEVSSKAQHTHYLQLSNSIPKYTS